MTFQKCKSILFSDDALVNNYFLVIFFAPTAQNEGGLSGIYWSSYGALWPPIDRHKHFPFMLYRRLYGLVAIHSNIRSRQTMALRHPFHSQSYRAFRHQNLPVRLQYLPACSIFGILSGHEFYCSIPDLKQAMYVAACPILVKRGGACRSDTGDKKAEKGGAHAFIPS
ncbi:hypothetical protein [Janthinobacterium sp. LB2P70]|uniref:hypothetical protein n=1 Tax=Janthinobacterium sp. LB2P70 TaxID=3424197 RepID=UPI003F28EA45